MVYSCIDLEYYYAHSGCGRILGNLERWPKLDIDESILLLCVFIWTSRGRYGFPERTRSGAAELVARASFPPARKFHLHSLEWPINFSQCISSFCWLLWYDTNGSVRRQKIC